MLLLVVFELLAPLPVTAFFAGADLALFAAERVVGAALSLLEVLLELARDFSPLVDDEVSPLLLDLRERRSTGILQLLGARLSGRTGGRDRVKGQSTQSRGKKELKKVRTRVIQIIQR